MKKPAMVLAAITFGVAIFGMSACGTKTQVRISGSSLSAGSLDGSVKGLSFNGVAPTVAKIKNSTYKLSRSFNILTKESFRPKPKPLLILSICGGSANYSE